MTLWLYDHCEVVWQFENFTSLLSQDLWPLNLAGADFGKEVQHSNPKVATNFLFFFFFFYFCFWMTHLYMSHFPLVHPSVCPSICSARYLRNQTSSNHNLFFLVVSGVKGQRKTQSDKKSYLLCFISKEPCIIWSSFMVHLCKMMISPGLFSFFF